MYKEFEPKKCFDKFINGIADDRRMADKNRISPIQGDTSKLIGNSAYGSMLLDPTKYRNIRYAFDSHNVSRQVNQPTFRHFNKLESDFFEVEHSKKQIVFGMPIQLGFFILQYARLRMLDFYYNCVDKYLDRKKYQYCSMDTDSAYFYLSNDSFQSLVSPSTLSHYNCINTSCSNALYIPTLANPDCWFPRTCCKEHNKFETPLVCLNSSMKELELLHYVLNYIVLNLIPQLNLAVRAFQSLTLMRNQCMIYI